MSTTVVQPGPAWSYSQLKNAETCLKRWYHYNVEKDVVEPESEQLRAGNRLHKAFEGRLKSKIPLPPDLAKFEDMLARIEASPGKLHTEQKMAITGDFRPCGFFDRKLQVWFRSVADAAKSNGDRVTVFDWKTGKPNDDHTQLQLMAATFFIHMPDIQRVRAALVFVHHGETSQAEFVREDQAEIWGEILPRVRVMQEARRKQEFPPRPSGLCRRYCAVVSCPHHGK